jgi:hypothetical protein
MASSHWRRTDRRVAKRLLSAAGLVFYSLAAVALIYSGVGLSRFVSGSGRIADLLLPACCLLLAVSHLGIGYQLRRRRVWARNVAVVFALVSLFLVPVGTVLAVLVICCIDSANRAGLFASPLKLADRGAPPPDPGLVLEFESPLAAERAS